MTDKEEAIAVMILISSSVRDLDNKTPKVSKMERHINQSIVKIFKTGQTYSAINKFGMPVEKPRLKREVYDLQDEVSEAWDKTRKEMIPKDGKWMVSMSTLVMALESLLNGNPYKYSLVSEKVLQGAVNSFISHVSHRKTTLDDIENARSLAECFRKNMNIKKDMRLKRLKYNIEQSMILEGKTC